MADRQAWKWDQNVVADLRGPRALEYIAHYLDRIDQSLERIAVAVESGGGNERLRLTLESLVGKLGER